MKKFITIRWPRRLAFALALFILPGYLVQAQQPDQVDVTAEKNGTIRIVKVIDGKTTVEEFDAGDMDGKMIWIEEETDGSGAVRTQKRVIRLDGAESEEIIDIREAREDGDHPPVFIFESDDETNDPDGKRVVVIEKRVEGKGAPEGKMQVHTIKVVNGDTVLDNITEEDAGTMIWREKSGHPGDAHVVIMHKGGDCDSKTGEKDVRVKVIKGDENAYKYEMIVVRSCKAVRVEEPAAAELEKIGAQGQSGNSLEVNKLEAFPSPNEGRFTVRFQLQNTRTPAQLRIFDLEGKQVYEENFSGSRTYEKQIDLGDVPAGVYLLRILQGEESMTRKLVVE